MTADEALHETPDNAVREYLAELIEVLDELDTYDYFGREGWRSMLMKER